jgi:hypothetical protein
MKDILKDIDSNIGGLGFIEKVKIVGEEDSTKIYAFKDTSLIIIAEPHNSVVEFKNITFGFPNLSKLSLHLKNPEYQEGEKISLVWETRHEGYLPTTICFENAAGDFQNNYALIGPVLADNQIPTKVFKGAKWDFEFEPSVTSIQRLKLQAAAHSEETVFRISTNNDCINVHFGETGSHTGNFTFYKGINGKLKTDHYYPIHEAISILNLSGTTKMKISSDGILYINVDSGLINYHFYLPGHSK